MTDISPQPADAAEFERACQRKRLKRFRPLLETLTILKQIDPEIQTSVFTPNGISLHGVMIDFAPGISFQIEVHKTMRDVAPWESLIATTIFDDTTKRGQGVTARADGIRSVWTAWGAIGEATALMHKQLADLLHYCTARPTPCESFKREVSRAASAWAVWSEAVERWNAYQGIPPIPDPATPTLAVVPVPSLETQTTPAPSPEPVPSEPPSPRPHGLSTDTKTYWFTIDFEDDSRHAHKASQLADDLDSVADEIAEANEEYFTTDIKDGRTGGTIYIFDAEEGGTLLGKFDVDVDWSPNLYVVRAKDTP